MERNKFDEARESRIFPSRLKALCPESDRHSQQALADHLGVSRQCVSNWIFGKTKPQEFETLLKIAQYFNVTTDWLLGMPNASKEINADKYQAMKTTGLSEKAIDNLCKASNSGNEAVNQLLSIPDFPSFISDLQRAMSIMRVTDCDEYHLVSASDCMNTVIVDPLDKEPIVMSTYSLIDYVLESSFNLLKQSFAYPIYLQTKRRIESGGSTHGNDNPTEE